MSNATEVSNVEITHFNWEGDNLTSTFPARVTFEAEKIILELTLGGSERKRVEMNLSAEAKAGDVVGRVANQSLRLVSVFLPNSSFSHTDVDDRFGMEVVALGGSSPEEIKLGLFAASEVSQALLIQPHDEKFQLRLELQQEGFFAHREENIEYCCDVLRIDISTSRGQGTAIDCSLGIGEESIVISADVIKPFELQQIASREKLRQVIFGSDYQVILLYCANIFQLGEDELEEIDPVEILATDGSKFHILLAGREGECCHLSDREGYFYRLIFHELGVETYRVDEEEEDEQ